MQEPTATQREEFLSHLVSEANNNGDKIVCLNMTDLLTLVQMAADNKASCSTEKPLTVTQVCEQFNLPYACIKSSKWRKEHNFPTHQKGGAYTKALFFPSEIQNWINHDGK